jgi:hypothetical protein
MSLGDNDQNQAPGKPNLSTYDFCLREQRSPLAEVRYHSINCLKVPNFNVPVFSDVELSHEIMESPASTLPSGKEFSAADANKSATKSRYASIVSIPTLEKVSNCHTSSLVPMSKDVI